MKAVNMTTSQDSQRSGPESVVGSGGLAMESRPSVFEENNPMNKSLKDSMRETYSQKASVMGGGPNASSVSVNNALSTGVPKGSIKDQIDQIEE